MADREMTNEEAIEILGGIRACYNIFDEYDEPKYAALSKAIFALKAEPTYEQLEEYCRKRCLVVVDGALFHEMESRWSAEPKLGRWVEDEYGIPHCSECGTINNTVYKNYCPNCGAKMDLPEPQNVKIINDGTYSAGNLYECDPEKNTDCKKTGCFINGGECRLTSNEAFKREGGEDHDG